MSDAIWNGLLGTLFTWFVTALGAAIVFLVPGPSRSGRPGQWQRRLHASGLGFAAGVMLAASYWSLLAPAIDAAQADPMYHIEGLGDVSWLAPLAGFLLGCVFVSYADSYLPDTLSIMAENEAAPAARPRSEKAAPASPYNLRKRKTAVEDAPLDAAPDETGSDIRTRIHRVLVMVAAITIHNAPEGLAVGCAFGAVGKTPEATFMAAVMLTIGIGIQNFPEGMAVSLPLHTIGCSKRTAFFYGQLSGAVEPLGGVLGAIFTTQVEKALPYALSFAAGAMIFVVCNELLLEANSTAHMDEDRRSKGGSNPYATWGCVAGFAVMMTLDVSLG